MQSRCRALTLVEVAVVLVAMGAGVLTLAAVHGALTEEARAAKCLSNLQRGMQAVLEYSVEYDGVLPGPVHPAIFRVIEDPSGLSTQREHSLSWLLGPYITPGDAAVTDPDIPNVVIDELFRCPTSTLISPDRLSSSGGCWGKTAYSYICNSWGPFGSPGSVFNPATAEAPSTDPPHYFGAWYLCDPSPNRSGVSWRPKRLDSIRNASAEWAMADAWYRRIASGSSRGGSVARQWLGTFAPHAAGYLANIPSGPYHRTNLRDVRSHRTQNTIVLPDIPLVGETNQAYFDGHVAPFVGDWKSPGQGGTVNPYWGIWGGEHSTSEPWYP